MAGGGDEVGWRNRWRARWRQLSEPNRALIVVAAELVFSVLCFAVDDALGYGVAVVFICLWLRRLPELPWRLGVEAALVACFAIAWAVGSAPGSVSLVLGVSFALTWIPARSRRWLLPLLLVFIAIAYPFFVGRLFTLPVFGAFPSVATGTYMVVFIMMAVGLNMVVGYAGLLDLGYVAFYATGAYTAGWFASAQFAGQECPKHGFNVQNCPVGLVPKLNFSLGGVGGPFVYGGIHISIFLIVLIAGLITAGFGVIIGLPTLRLRGDYLAIVTLGFGEILPQVAQNGNSLGGFNLTNGPNGITPIDSPGFGNGLSALTGHFLPADYLTCCTSSLLGHQIENEDLFFWTALVLLIITVFCTLRLRDSRLGRAWIAIREDETAAAAMGIPLMRTKTWAYASGAFFGGVAGAYYAVVKSGTFPDDFYFNISVFILCMVILGGMGNVWGVIAGAGFLAYLDQFGLGNIGFWLNQNIDFFGHRPNIDVPLYASGIYGVIIVVVMLFRPEGLLPSKRRAAELHSLDPHDQPLYDIQHEGA